MEIGWILLIAAVVVGLWAVMTYNGLVSLKNRVEEAWADIEVQLKRRYNLIPNLVETVKGYARHEASTFENVTNARNQALNATTVGEHADADNMLSQTLKSLFAVAEAYPELKANQNFLALQQELSDTENKVQAARRFYNGNVRDFNTKLQVFPTNLVASMLGFEKRDFFEIENAAERAVPEVKF